MRVVIVQGGKVFKTLSTNLSSILTVPPLAVFRELPVPSLTKRGLLRRRKESVINEDIEEKLVPAKIIYPHKEPVDHGSRDYCIKIVKQAEKAGVIKELVLLMSAFRNMYQRKIVPANREETTVCPKGKHYSEGSE